VISIHDQQAGEVPWEADSRDRVMRDGKTAGEYILISILIYLFI